MGKGIEAQFDVAKAEARVMEGIRSRMPRAASHLAGAIQARIPVRSGKMKSSVRTAIGDNSFKVIVGKFYAFFVEAGHKVGARRSKRARSTRLLAKNVRRERKVTGNLSLKEKETALRARAKAEQVAYDKERSKATFVAGQPFVQPALDAERENVIAILAGRQ